MAPRPHRICLIGPESTGKSPGDPGYGVTASGAYVKDGHTIAVDPRLMPSGQLKLVQELEGDLTTYRSRWHAEIDAGRGSGGFP